MSGQFVGVAVGVVTDNRDPEGLSRVRVRLPWRGEGDTSSWARLAVPMAGDDRGTYFLPEIDDEVLVAAEQGAPSRLYVLGMLWNGTQRPPADNDDGANNSRLVKSRSGHLIRFNDDESTPEVEVRLQDGKRVLLDEHGISISDGGQNVITLTSTSGTIRIEAGQKLSLAAPNVSIEAAATMTVRSSGTLTLSGALVEIN